MLDLVATYKALGGGWDGASDEPVAQPSSAACEARQPLTTAVRPPIESES